MNDDEPGPMLNDIQAAQLLGVSEWGLRQWRSRRQGPAYVKLGRSVRYRQSDLLEFIASGIREPSKGFRNEKHAA